MSFTEAEFLTVIAEGNQAQMKIGATITLTNTYCSTYEVIGVNHDGTTNTVDIMATTQIYTRTFNATGNNKYYAHSDLRTWLNSFINLFSTDIRNAAKTMTVQTDPFGTYNTSDKVKILSLTEIGATGLVTGEGSFYTGAFTSAAWNTAVSNRWRAKGAYGSPNGIWLRSPTSYSNAVYGIFYNYKISTLTVDAEYGVLPVLRF